MTTTDSNAPRTPISGVPAGHASNKPGQDCPLCPRLQAFRTEWRKREPGWFNAPVACFGPPTARLLIVGLAPGLQGANRTGRPFTGDYAGVLLYETLARFGFTRGSYRASPDHGLELVDARISNAVRCVPPENKPLPAEIGTCRRFPDAELVHWQFDDPLVATDCRKQKRMFHSLRDQMVQRLRLFALVQVRFAPAETISSRAAFSA